MPRNVRNFWLTARVDGRPTAVATGPRAKDGGMSVALQMRDKGEIVTALTIECQAGQNGALVIHIFDGQHKGIGRIEAQR